MSGPEYLAVIEERIENVPLSSLLKPFLYLSGWKPWRLVMRVDGMTRIVEPREFNKIYDLNGFTSSDELRIQ